MQPDIAIDDAAQQLAAVGYLPTREVAGAVYLAERLGRPLLIEGPAGVGKTALGRAVAAWRQVPLVRLQCYEGLDASQALYDWDYPRQLLAARLAAEGQEGALASLYGPAFLMERPLLRALRASPAPVLLIDEVDRADEAFEALLLEFLGEFQVTIPEIGTVSAAAPPRVMLTSNRTRDLSDALRRRCLYLWLDYPDPDREANIIRLAAPEVEGELARAVAAALAQLRPLALMKPPGLAEALDWARALTVLGWGALTPEAVSATLPAVVKTAEDLDVVRRRGWPGP